MKILKPLVPLFTLLLSASAYAQNSPFYIWGSGLDGSTFQKTAIYSDTNYGLLFEAAKDASNNKLNISFNWRGGGTTPLFIKGSDGNVGIGTTFPTTNLHIANLNNGGIRIGQVGDVGNTSVAMGALANQYNLDFTGYRDIVPDQIGARIAALRFNNYANNTAYVQNTALAFYTNPSGMGGGTTDLQERMRITPDGKIGVGTTSPAFKFEVVGNGQVLRNPSGGDYTTLRLYNEQNTATRALEIDYSSGQYGGSLINNGPVGESAAITTTGAYPLTLGTSNTARMTLLPTGNVGIGTTTPDAKLAVKGTIHTQEVKVDLDGAMVPDYVFEKDYSLPSLEELKSYIDANKHLPEVPSAKEMETNGMNLGEMNLLLLKKIEELTLHLIKQEERIKQLEKSQNKN